MKKVLVIDNYDSFTYNLVHIIREHPGCRAEVFRNDQISVKAAGAYEYIVLSPGPGLPSEAGIMEKVIEKYASDKKIFGVCLGMQAIAEVFGGSLKNLPQVYHGVATPGFREDNNDPVFEGVPQEFTAGRYHSWVVTEKEFPQELLVTSRDSEGRIMSLRHRHYPVFGTQFHPESILTPEGKKVIFNFLDL